MKFKNLKYIVIVLFCTMTSLFSQDSITNIPDIASVIYLDSFVVLATNDGLDIDAFIERMSKDTTFYEAFKRIRHLDYYNKNHFQHNVKKDVNYKSIIHQKIDENKRTFAFISETSNKYYKRNGEYKYYTSKMFDKLFYMRDSVNLSRSDKIRTTKPKTRIGRYKEELVKLIFQPGVKIDVPLISKKTMIFSPKMIPLYDYAITIANIDGIKCYSFIISAKDNDSDKTIIKSLITYFTKENFTILKREMYLSQKNMLYKFNISLTIELLKINDKYAPSFINYNGFWKIPFKRNEDFNFKLKFQYN